MNRFLCFLISFAVASSSASALDVNGQLKNAQFEKSASDPVTNLVDGRVYWNTATDLVKWYDLTALGWRTAVTTDQSQTLTNKTLTSPTLTTPALGVATATSINKVAITAPATSATLTIADGKTATVSNTLTFTGTDSSSVAFGAGGTAAYTGNKLSTFAATTSAELATVISNETGSGLLVYGTSPVLVTPDLGTPTAAVLTSATGLPLTTGITGTLGADHGGTGVANNAAATTTRSGNHALTLTTTGTTGVTLPTTGTLATLAGTEALTNKDVDGGTASNSSRITAPKATKATLTALTRKEATLVYATDESKLYVDSGSALVAVGSSNGVTNSNLISGGDAEDIALDPWATYADAAAATPVDGTGGSPNVTKTRTTTTADLINGTASWKLSKSAANRQGEGWSANFSLPAKSQLYSSLVALQFDFYMSTAAISDAVRVYVYDRDTSTLITPSFVTCGGGTTPSLTSMTTACHAELAWVSTTSDDYRIILHVASSSATALDLVVDNLYVGQTRVAVGAAIGSWTSFTPTFAGGSGTGSGQYRRVGDTMEVYALNTAAATWSGNKALTIPAGLTIDTTKLPTVGAEKIVVGTSTAYDTSVTQRYSGAVVYSTTTSVRVQGPSATADVWNATIPFTWQNGADEWSVFFTVPIAEWSGSGISFGENKVEYACSSTGTWDAAAASTDTIYGPAGCPMSSSLAAARTKVVQWQTTIQPTDTIVGEVDVLGLGVFAPFENYGIASRRFPSVDFGVDFYNSAVNQSTAVFRKNSVPGTTYNSATGALDWGTFPANTARWRLKKFSSGAAVGFGMANATTPGLVSRFIDWTSSTPTLAGSGSLTVSCTTNTFAYTLIGNMMTIAYALDSCTLGGVMNSQVLVTIPGGFTATKEMWSSVYLLDNGTREVGNAFVSAAGTQIKMRKNSAGNYTASSGNAGFFGTITIQVN